MKTKQYCVIENNDGAIDVHTYEYSEAGLDAAQNKVIEWWKETAGVHGEDIIFDIGVPRGEAIANMSWGSSDILFIVS
jgi:hypothetical protein